MIVTLTFMGCPFSIYSLFMDIQNSFLDIHKSFWDKYKSFFDIPKSVEYWIAINRFMDIQK